MTIKSFQLQANAIRAESRALMQKLRSERLQSSRQAHKAKVTAEAARVAPAAPAPAPLKPSAIIASRKIRAAAASAVVTPVVEPTPIRSPRPAKKQVVAAVQIPVVAAVVPEVIEVVAKPAKKLKNAKQVSMPVVVVPAPKKTPKPRKPAVDRDAWAAKSISVIPAMGPGMIWRLGQVGVNTLGDVARLDAEGLRDKLGALGKLVPVDNWIAFAKRAA
jgi:hypothetical protein